jgi:hypothetical protein
VVYSDRRQVILNKQKLEYAEVKQVIFNKQIVACAENKEVVSDKQNLDFAGRERYLINRKWNVQRGSDTC